VFEYHDVGVTDTVITGMNNLEIAGSRISVQRVPKSSAAVLLKPPKPVFDQSLTEFAVDHCSIKSTVIQLENMTSAEDLADDQAYEELIEDVTDECSNYASIKSVIIPRDTSFGALGKIFVQCNSVDGAEKVLKAVNGRKFNGKIVEAHFCPESVIKKVSSLVNLHHFFLN
jgi:splicing factor U2AF subunit